MFSLRVKKVVSLISISILLIAVLIGCVVNENQANTQEPKENITDASDKGSKSDSENGLPDQKRPLKFLMTGIERVRPDSDEEDIIRKEIIKRTGIEYIYEEYANNNYYPKLNLYIASGELPDMLVSSSLSDIKLWAENGMILPLDNLIEKYGQNLVKTIDTEEEFPRATFDGKLYALPRNGYNTEVPGSEKRTHGIVIRKDWLDKLGLSIPETFDEFYNVIKVFVNSDPDGNGKKDDWYGESGGNIKAICSAFGLGGSNGFVLQDGKLVHSRMTEEWIESHKIGAKWYKEGIMHPEAILLKYNTLQEKIINQEIGVSWSGTSFTRSDGRIEPGLKAKDPDADFIMISALTGPNGERGNYNKAYYGGSSRVITSACEQPELVIALLDWFAKDIKNNFLQIYGVKGTHWELTEDNTVKRIPPYDKYEEFSKIGMGATNYLWLVNDATYYAGEYKQDLVRMSKYLKPAYVREPVPAEKKYPDVTEPRFLFEVAAKVIVGEATIEELEAAQERWYEIGGDEYTKQVNEVYQQMLAEQK